MRILLPVDDNEDRAIRAAEAVTTLPNVSEEVKVTVLNVHEKIEVTDGDGGNVSSEDWYDEEDYPISVNKAVEVLDSAQISTEIRREHADPAEAIIEVSEKLDADRIVMAGQKRTPVGKVLFGSVTQSVLLNAGTPVTVVGE